MKPIAGIVNFVRAAIGRIANATKGRSKMKLENLKFRYYNGEKECPKDIPVNFWTAEKYLADHVESGELDGFKERYDAAVSDDEFSSEYLPGDWDNPFHFIAKAEVSEHEKFTAYCCRRVDDFTDPRGYESYFYRPLA